MLVFHSFLSSSNLSTRCRPMIDIHEHAAELAPRSRRGWTLASCEERLGAARTMFARLASLTFTRECRWSSRVPLDSLSALFLSPIISNEGTSRPARLLATLQSDSAAAANLPLLTSHALPAIVTLCELVSLLASSPSCPQPEQSRATLAKQGEHSNSARVARSYEPMQRSMDARRKKALA
mmetsp:Transcript_16036/g.40599  ORF Transcript_16036/g.40599 Transcript_16036/m.40599 type:complete len:181 (+) Transcript_16036:130-672(+)